MSIYIYETTRKWSLIYPEPVLVSYKHIIETGFWVVEGCEVYPWVVYTDIKVYP